MFDRLSNAPREEAHLPPGDVHVWVARLDEIDGRGENFEWILSEEELKRAGRFHFELDRVRFMKGLGVMRSLLGRYLGTDPKQIEFGREKKNKPVLSGPFARNGVHFNMSRSKGLALYAFSRNRAMGVDVEKMERTPEMDRIVRRFFAPREIRDYLRLPMTARFEAFFRCWTRKEAFLKATGDGLLRPLNSFSVSLLPEEPPRITDTGGDGTQATEWFVQDLPVEGGYAAAIVVDTPNCRVHYGHWLDDPGNGRSVSGTGGPGFHPRR